MITKNIKALFQFIEFLHSNIENFKQFDEVINELNLLDYERGELKPRINFSDKMNYDKIQAKIKEKFKVIQENIITPIRSKATGLNVCDFQNEPKHYYFNSESDLHNLKENFGKNDLPVIFKHKNKYIEFRVKTNCTYFSLGSFFSDLDEVLKEFFDFFKESPENEFESFETKTIPVNNIREAIEQFKKGNKKISFPFGYLTTPLSIQNNNVNVEFIETYKKEVTEERKKELRKCLSEINTPEEKIIYLENLYNEYLKNIPPEILEVSGRTSFQNFEKGTPLLWDRYLLIEIDTIKKIISNNKQAEKKTEQKIKTEFVPKTFKELFVKPEKIIDCLSLLKNTDTPCINDENQFLRNKGIFVVWFNVLESKKMFNSNFKNDAERAAILNYNFSGLCISQSLFGKGNKRAKENYKSFFESEISTIKHS